MRYGKRILILNEEPESSCFITQVLRRWGYDVWLVRDWLDLRPAIVSWRPTAVFVEFYMLEEYSKVLMDVLKSAPWCRDLPVLFYSLKEDIAEKAFEAGADGWIGRPMRVSRLQALMQKFAPLVFG